MEFKTIFLNDLIARLRTMQLAPDAVISIDGVCGVGRQIAARELATAFHGTAVKADGLPDAKLAKAILETRKSGIAIVEGALMRRRMADCGIRPDLCLYVVPAQESARYFLFEGILFESLADFLRKLSDPQDREIVKYHHSFHPIIHADFIVQDRVEG